MSDLPEIEDIKRVTYSPDDVIVVRFKDRVSEDNAKRIADRLRGSFPTQKILILDAGASLDVVTPE